MEPTRTITLDGISYDVTQFSQGVQQAVMIYNKFSAQLQYQQLEVMKTQAAISQVGNQISEAVQKELAAKKAAAPAANDQVEDAQVANGADHHPV